MKKTLSMMTICILILTMQCTGVSADPNMFDVMGMWYLNAIEFFGVAGKLFAKYDGMTVVYNRHRVEKPLPVLHGIVQAEGDNWLITNLHKQNKQSYFKQAEVSTPEGFMREKNDYYSLTSDPNETSFWFIQEDDTHPVKYFFITGNARNAVEMAASIQPEFLMEYGAGNVSDVMIGPVGNLIGQYFTMYSEHEVFDDDDSKPGDSQISDDEEEKEESAPILERTEGLVVYFPALHNSTIVFVMFVRVDEDTERPTTEAMLDMAEPLAAAIRVSLRH